MDLLHGHLGAQQVGFARAGSPASDIDSGDSSVFGDDDGATGRPLVRREVADFKAGDIGEGSRGRAFRFGGGYCTERMQRQRGRQDATP